MLRASRVFLGIAVLAGVWGGAESVAHAPSPGTASSPSIVAASVESVALEFRVVLPRLVREGTPTASPAPSGQQVPDLLFTLDSFEAETGSDGWSDYTYSLKNIGVDAVDLSYLAIQSWYSADAVRGGGDDCAAAGRALGAEAIAPGDSATASFGANLEPNPQYWPQCVDRMAGFVIVEVRTVNASYFPWGRWVAYPVTRSP